MFKYLYFYCKPWYTVLRYFCCNKEYYRIARQLDAAGIDFEFEIYPHEQYCFRWKNAPLGTQFNLRPGINAYDHFKIAAKWALRTNRTFKIIK